MPYAYEAKSVRQFIDKKAVSFTSDDVRATAFSYNYPHTKTKSNPTIVFFVKK